MIRNAVSLGNKEKTAMHIATYRVEEIYRQFTE